MSLYRKYVHIFNIVNTVESTEILLQYTEYGHIVNIVESTESMLQYTEYGHIVNQWNKELQKWSLDIWSLFGWSLQHRKYLQKRLKAWAEFWWWRQLVWNQELKIPQHMRHWVWGYDTNQCDVKCYESQDTCDIESEVITRISVTSNKCCESQNLASLSQYETKPNLLINL